MKKAILFLALFLSFISLKAQNDTIWLKSGNVMRGQIFSFADSTIRIKSENDTVVYTLKEIKSIRYHGPELRELKRVQGPGKNKNRNIRIEAKPIKMVSRRP